MISMALMIVIVTTWLLGVREHGPFSFVTAGLVGMTVYSLPAVLGLVYPYHFNLPSPETTLITASSGMVAVTVIAWAALLFVIAFPRRRLSISAPATVSLKKRDRAALSALLMLCLGGMFLIAAQEGPFYFLKARDEQSESIIRLLWRWTPAIGLLLAIKLRHYTAGAVFLFGLLTIFISGDRTIFVITFMGVIVLMGRTTHLFRFLLCLTSILAGLAIALIAFFGKPVYLSIKAGSLEPLYYSVSPEGLEQILKTLEPFIVANTLDLVVSYEFSLPATLLLEGLLGQLLIVPSAFGIDANSFNTEFTASFASMLSYGIAGNFWAQAYTIGGYGAVVAFAVIYGLLLRLADYGSSRYGGAIGGAWLIIGALVAVYSHRNASTTWLLLPGRL